MEKQVFVLESNQRFRVIKQHQLLSEREGVFLHNTYQQRGKKSSLLWLWFWTQQFCLPCQQISLNQNVQL